MTHQPKHHGSLSTRPPAQQSRVEELQRKTIWVLSIATVLGGLGMGASLSAGALIIVDLTGNAALSGFGSTMNAIGAAIAGIPLARAAARRGRRVALATGNLVAMIGAAVVILAATLSIPALVFVGLAIVGVAAAVQLQARFAATDLSAEGRRGRDLSLVVWSITIGAVTGPNLIGPGEVIGAALGVHPLSGIFVFAIVAQLLACLTVYLGLRPDPLLLARELSVSELSNTESGTPSTTSPNTTSPSKTSQSDVAKDDAGSATKNRQAQVLAVVIVALAHGIMVGIMAMTPLHITEHGGAVTLVGVTISLHIAGMYALSPIFGLLVGKFGALPVVFSGYGVLGVAALLAAVGGDNMPVVQLALVLLGVGWGLATVAGATLVTNLTPLSDRPKRQGQSDTAMNATGAIFGACSGVLFSLGGFPLISVICGLLIVVAIVCTLRIRSLVTH